MAPPIIKPPFNEETARAKVQAAQDAWNSRDPERVSLGYTPQSDWRNRDRWDSYEAAACEMIEKTGTAAAPWVLVEANNKEWARVKVIKAVVQHVKAALAASEP